MKPTAKFSELIQFLDGQNSSSPYQTTLDPSEELDYRNWVTQNNIPADDSPTADYDMRGFFKDPNTQPEISSVDGMPHFTDKYKTPYHRSLSNESQYAPPGSPHWEGNALVNPAGDVVHLDLPNPSEDRRKLGR